MRLRRLRSALQRQPTAHIRRARHSLKYGSWTSVHDPSWTSVARSVGNYSFAAPTETSSTLHTFPTTRSIAHRLVWHHQAAMQQPLQTDTHASLPLQLKAALVELLEQPGAQILRQCRFFRGQMQTIISRSLQDLDIAPVPSRRCFSLISELHCLEIHQVMVPGRQLAYCHANTSCCHHVAQ